MTSHTTTPWLAARTAGIWIGLGATLAAAPASAHPGHLAEIAGHSHWISLGAGLAAAALIALLGAKRPNHEAADDAAENDDQSENEAEPAEANA